MKLELLRSFATLAGSCHFGAAARQLGISQPSLSKQIRRLEDMLGAPLFRRGRQGTELTTFGRQLLAEVQPMLSQAENVWERSLRSARGERGRLAIGFTYSSVAQMARILARFQARFPDVEVSFEDIASRVQEERLERGQLDIGFVRLPVRDGLGVIPVAQDRLAFVFPTTLAGQIEDFDSPAVRTLPFFALQTELAPGLDTYIQRLFTARGFRPATLHRVNGSLTQLSLVAAGLGVALVHEASVLHMAGPNSGVVVRPIADPLAAWETGLVWRRDDEQNPVMRRFLDVATECL